jgi:hypothetical protein
MYLALDGAEYQLECPNSLYSLPAAESQKVNARPAVL